MVTIFTEKSRWNNQLFWQTTNPIMASKKGRELKRDFVPRGKINTETVLDQLDTGALNSKNRRKN